MKPPLLDGTCSRRTLLAAPAIGLLARWLDPQPRRVVWVIAGGGERPSDTWAATSGPWKTLADRGTTYRSTRLVLGPDGDGLRPLLGGGVPKLEKGETWPLALPWYALAQGMAREKVWWISDGTPPSAPGPLGWHANVEASRRPLHLDTRPLADPGFGELLEELAPKVAPGQPTDAEERLRGALHGGAAGVQVAARTLAGILTALHGEVPTSGPGAGDARALAAARLLIARTPARLVTVHLSETSVADRSIADYEAVLARRAEGLTRLLDTIAKDRELAASTMVVVAPDRARAQRAVDEKLPLREATDARSRVGLFLAGPGIARKQTPRRSVRNIDVAPTLARWLALPRPPGGGRAIDGLFD